jgi:glutaminyl-peptide cyclotransferase
MLTVALFAACKSQYAESKNAESKPAETIVNAASLDPSPAAPPAPRVDGAAAFKLCYDFVSQGPRYVDSEGHKKAENFIHQHLAVITVEDDAFTAKTAAGDFPMRNIIAKIPGKKDGIIVIAGHYDTNLPLKNLNFVGANDGGSNVGLMLQMANEMKSRPNDGYSVWFVFTDGEEAMINWSAEDSVYGSKHLAKLWKQDGTAAKIKAFLLLDMIGDKDLGIFRETNSTPWLMETVQRAAARLGYARYFNGPESAIEDDHLPFKAVGIPVADLIDLNYGFNNVYHHTTEDTMDKLSPQSLEIVGNVVYETIRALNTH